MCTTISSQTYAIIFFFFFSGGGSAQGLHCCAWAFSSCGEQGPLMVAVCSLEHVLCNKRSQVASRVHRLQSSWHRLQQLWRAGLTAPQYMGSFWTRDQTHGPLHWQADSYPLYYQENSCHNLEVTEIRFPKGHYFVTFADQN